MRFNVNLSELLPKIAPSQYFELVQGNVIATYNTMLMCVADDDGNPLTGADAKKAIDKACESNMTKFYAIQSEFIKAFTDALVPPESGDGLNKVGSAAQPSPRGG